MRGVAAGAGERSKGDARGADGALVNCVVSERSEQAGRFGCCYYGEGDAVFRARAGDVKVLQVHRQVSSSSGADGVDCMYFSFSKDITSCCFGE